MANIKEIRKSQYYVAKRIKVYFAIFAIIGFLLASYVLAVVTEFYIVKNNLAKSLELDLYFRNFFQIKLSLALFSILCIVGNILSASIQNDLRKHKYN